MYKRQHLGNHAFGIFYHDIITASIPEVSNVFADLLTFYHTFVWHLNLEFAYLSPVLHLFQYFVTGTLELGVEHDTIVLNLLCVVLALSFALRDQLGNTK